MFVLDASVTAAWLFPDEFNAYVEGVLDRLRQSAATVPAIWGLEVANILLVAERRQRVTEAQTASFIQFLQDLPITIRDSIPVSAIPPILATGRRHDLSAYDSCYLQLCMIDSLPLATQDEQLRIAAEQAGVSLVT
jgi:predicted nucleic acid-binding protein